MKIDIGGGTKCRPDHINLDPVHGEGEWKRYAQDIPWPVDHDSVENIFSSHCLEHVPAGADRIAVFNEAHRALRWDGIFEVRVPHAFTWQGVADPTHVSLWVPESFMYFDGSMKADADYGILKWMTMYLDIENGFEVVWKGMPCT